VRGWPPPKYGMPAGSKRADVEITQVCDLDVECLAVRYRRTDPHARHETQDDCRLGLREAGLVLFPPETLYTRLPSTFFELSLSLRRLRTTPARKPRTECCCQPVVFIIAAIVAPVGD
jgi:hypothetical protein